MDNKLKELIDRLEDSRSSARKSAIRKIRKKGYVEAGPKLLSTLRSEMGDHQQWEIQYLLIMALGETSHLQSLDYLKELIKGSYPNNAVPCALGDAVSRLSIIHDGGFEWHQETIEKSVDVWLVHAVLRALAILRVSLEIELVATIMNFATRVSNSDESLVWVAAILVDHDHPNKFQFLELHKHSSNQQIARSAAAAIEGRHLKWSPF